MRVYDPCAGSGGMLDLLPRVRRGARRGRQEPGPVRPGEQRHHLGDLQDEHDPARDHQRGHRQRGHPRRPAAQGRVRRAAAASTGCSPTRRSPSATPPRAWSTRSASRYGFTPETGKKADLMFAQHILAVLEPDGIGATVMPHGVLFRGGDEKKIRQGIIEADRLDAVIGLAPNLFYGTGIPACVLVLRGTALRDPAERAARSCSSTPTASSPRAAPRTTWARSTSRRSSPPTTSTRTSPPSPASWTSRSCATTTSTSTSAATSTTPRRPSPRTSGRTCTAASRRRRSPPTPPRFAAYGIDVDALFEDSERMPGYRDFPKTGWQGVLDQIPVLAARRKRSSTRPSRTGGPGTSSTSPSFRRRDASWRPGPTSWTHS